MLAHSVTVYLGVVSLVSHIFGDWSKNAIFGVQFGGITINLEMHDVESCSRWLDGIVFVYIILDYIGGIKLVRLTALTLP